ncbi:aryl-alcohol dehydrogenase-like predicted oxidoreductase [Natrinema hispanicum]|uniref:Aryl-alcohol dehydrogenase-like predicted oxidoreductase n=2 Tax=Natrinema hispanicum TaxID=392421 RepID=A0A482YF32_9EURY|nr:aryl-alcohol dehydrogenase-like predicted oxidoreductase [Natrinema hispanicum]
MRPWLPDQLTCVLLGCSDRFLLLTGLPPSKEQRGQCKRADDQQRSDEHRANRKSVSRNLESAHSEEGKRQAAKEDGEQDPSWIARVAAGTGHTNACQPTPKSDSPHRMRPNQFDTKFERSGHPKFSRSKETSMQHSELGESGVEVSEVGFGAWTVGTDWWGDRSEDDAIEMLQYAVEQGITYFDTGDVYGHGHSEELVGQALAEVRDEVTIATKVGYDFYNNPQAGHGELPKEMDPEYLREAVEKSLDRLEMDSVDVLQLHNADVDEITPDVLELFDELEEEGKIDATGLALGPSIGWLAEGDLAIEEEFDSVQLVWNVLEQEVGNHFLETIERTGSSTSLIPRVPHSSGILNEQVTPETELEEGDHRGFRPDEWYETGWEKLEKLRFLERDGERTMGQASIAWLLSHEPVATVTPTFRTKADIDEWAAASDVPKLSDEEMDRVAELYENDFDIDRDDGMDALRSSVDGEDIESAGLDKLAAD